MKGDDISRCVSSSTGSRLVVNLITLSHRASLKTHVLVLQREMSMDKELEVQVCPLRRSQSHYGRCHADFP